MNTNEWVQVILLSAHEYDLSIYLPTDVEEVDTDPVPTADPVPAPKALKLKATRSNRKNKVASTSIQDEVTAKDLKRIAQLEKEEAAARSKVQKQAEKQAERDAKITKKARLEEQAVLDDTAESEAAEALVVALAVEKRKPPTIRDVAPVIVIGKKKPTTEAPMTHGATTDNDFESRIMIKVNNQLESALQASVDASTQVMKELRHIQAGYTDLKEKSGQLQSAILSLCRDAPTKRPISEVNQCDDVFKRISLESIDTKRREDIDTNRHSGASSEKAKINMLLKLALAQQESTYVKIENASKSDELEALKATAERARNKEVNALRAAADLKKNDETLASYLNSMF